jgi:hypothetical protein
MGSSVWAVKQDFTENFTVVYTGADMDTRVWAVKQDFTVSVHWCCHGYQKLSG